MSTVQSLHSRDQFKVKEVGIIIIYSYSKFHHTAMRSARVWVYQCVQLLVDVLLKNQSTLSRYVVKVKLI